MLHLNPHWANLPLFARKGWKMLPLDEFSDSVNERGEPTNAAEDKMEEAVQTPAPNPPPPNQVPNNKQTALKLMQQDLQAMLNTPAASDPVFAQYKKAIEDLTIKTPDRHRSIPGQVAQDNEQ